MTENMYRQYRIKVYLNARHYIILNNCKGEVHPHTWEFSLLIRFSWSDFREFTVFEKGIEDYLAPYQNTVMNSHEPFDKIVPTLENMTDYFSRHFSSIISELGGLLMQIEASETPTRSYILDVPDDEEKDMAEERSLSDMIDAVLDDILTE